MIKNPFSRAPLHEHADAEQRVLAVAQLAPDSEPLARLLTEDPDRSVRAAAASRCTSLAALAAAWTRETDPGVQAGLASTLGAILSESTQVDAVNALLHDEQCTDAIRADVARRAGDGDRRRIAIDAIRNESELVAIALEADQTETRKAAADRVHTAIGLRRLADSATNRDRGVARDAKKRLDALETDADRETNADDVLARMAALENEPGPILTPLVELERRWQALELVYDTERQARYAEVKRSLQARFDREQEIQRDRARWVRRWRDWVNGLATRNAPDALIGLRAELVELREESSSRGDAHALAALEEAGSRIEKWENEETERQQALLAAAQAAIETEAQASSAAASAQNEQQAGAARQQLHALLHTAEQALAAGQLKVARGVADQLRPLRAAAGRLPPPTTKRIGQLMQSLTQLEKWETFGQQNARIQLCERAEALATETIDTARLAKEIHSLREAWKALDKQYAGVPKALWTRFDGACTKAYAPAAQFFAQRAAQRKEARGQREAFIAMAIAHAPALLAEPRDWRAIERWLRETDQRWRASELGGVAPAEWDKMDAELRAALAPLREAQAVHRKSASTDRVALIEEVAAIAANPGTRDAIGKVKAAQARWQEQAKANPLPQRDDRALWERFRAACDAVFESRKTERKKEDEQKHEGRRALDALLERLSQLANSSEDEGAVRRALRDIESEWQIAKRQVPSRDPALGSFDGKFKAAKSGVDAMLTSRTRERQAAVWQTLAAKEQLCEALEQMVLDASDESVDSGKIAQSGERWAALPALTGAWEQKLAGRRDAAIRALEGNGANAYRTRIERSSTARREALLELELSLGLAPPAELEAARRALQLQQLKARFGGASAAPAPSGAPSDRLVAWSAEPGIISPSDRERTERIFAAVAKR